MLRHGNEPVRSAFRQDYALEEEHAAAKKIDISEVVL